MLAPGSGPLAVDATAVYWASGSVMSVPLGGGTPVMLASGVLTPHDIAVDATCVYWTDNSSKTVSKVAK